MTATAFDTYAAAKALREAGFDERQAESVVATVRDAITGGVAAKTDIAHLEDKIEHIEDKMATKADLAALETRVTVRFVGIAVGIVLANAGLTFALLKLLP